MSVSHLPRWGVIQTQELCNGSQLGRQQCIRLLIHVHVACHCTMLLLRLCFVLLLLLAALLLLLLVCQYSCCL